MGKAVNLHNIKGSRQVDERDFYIVLPELFRDTLRVDALWRASMSATLRFMRSEVRAAEKVSQFSLSPRIRNHLVRTLAGHIRDRRLFDHHAFQLIEAGVGSEAIIDSVKYRRMGLAANRIVIVVGWFPSVLESRSLDREQCLSLAEKCYMHAANYWARTCSVPLANRIYSASENIRSMLDVLYLIRYRMSEDMRRAMMLLQAIMIETTEDRIIKVPGSKHSP